MTTTRLLSVEDAEEVPAATVGSWIAPSSLKISGRWRDVVMSHLINPDDRQRPWPTGPGRPSRAPA